MKVVVMGAGAVGGYFGGKLATSDVNVTLIARGEHLAKMKEDGLRVKSDVHEDFNIQVNATDDPGEVGIVDLVLFTVKAYDTRTAAEQAAPMVGEETKVLSLQNGIDNEKILARIFGREKVVGGVAYIFSKVTEPGVISHEALGQVEIGELDGKITNRLSEIRNVFENSGVPCDISDDIEKVLWRKLAFNCALNAITALTRTSLDEILTVKESADVFKSTISEAVRVGIAEGVDMNECEVVKSLMKVAENAGGMESSMLHDLRMGKELEIGPINGKILELGKKDDIRTPVNKTLYGCLKAVNRNLTQ